MFIFYLIEILVSLTGISLNIRCKIVLIVILTVLSAFSLPLMPTSNDTYINSIFLFEEFNLFWMFWVISFVRLKFWSVWRVLRESFRINILLSIIVELVNLIASNMAQFYAENILFLGGSFCWTVIFFG